MRSGIRFPVLRKYVETLSIPSGHSGSRIASQIDVRYPSRETGRKTAPACAEIRAYIKRLKRDLFFRSVLLETGNRNELDNTP